ncbi:flagellar M-ring protein FliF [Guyparkeria hydrothermalis]|uniref:flagellar basal-body MS-ring/collar protein FliF n=1 Tax=Guyparkeria hydrothermalis TaxID=923 RepID=UPI002020CD32|nr:flagellar basal-body MS-ring/collar protein FliF [Guyparkeria hydrothermalis]MCL7744528.1 flagellar M-ring protein FliF [Guyparkeria hydrothermalis]
MAQGSAITTTPTGSAAESPRWIRQMDAFTQSSSFRQLLLLIALAAVISFMVGFFLWGSGKSMVPLYQSLDTKASAEVVEALKAAGEPYELAADGTVKVGADRLPEVRMLMAQQGLPGGDGTGLEMLNQDQSLGTSQFIEKARYRRAVETELARSIQTIGSVRAARVHIAQPEKSVFVRDRKTPTASVVVDIKGGSTLSRGQVNGIVHLVASSINDLSPENVSVIDQAGNLLTSDGDGAAGMGLTSRQFRYRQNLEQAYARRIESLLAPIMGSDRVRAQVSADIDFSRREGTSQTYGPGEGVLLSEQVNETVRSLGGGENIGGMPGAIANQPPGGGEVNPGNGDGGLAPPQDLTVEEFQTLAQTPIDSDRSETRNYNVDREIQHTQFASGQIEKLSVAVLLDENVAGSGAGQGEPEDPQAAEAAAAARAERLDRMRALVAQAVGIDEARGDQITLSSFPFVDQDIEPVSTPLWEQGWFWTTLKNAGMGLALLLVFLLVARPLLKMLADSRRERALPPAENGEPNPAGQYPVPAQYPDERRAQGGENEQEDEDDLSNVPELIGNASYTDKLRQLRKSVSHDPKAVAAVIKQWTHEEN